MSTTQHIHSHYNTIVDIVNIHPSIYGYACGPMLLYTCTYINIQHRDIYNIKIYIIFIIIIQYMYFYCISNNKNIII